MGRMNHFRTLYRNPVTRPATFLELQHQFHRQNREAVHPLMAEYPNYTTELLSILKKYHRSKKKRK